MKRRSLILIVLIVLLPVGLLTWLGLRIARDEQAMTQQRFRSLMEQRLQDVNRVIGTQFQVTERLLRQVTAVDDINIDRLREIVRNEPQVTQLFVLSAEGTLLYPNPADALNGTELSFLQQASKMFTDRDLQSAVALAESASSNGDFRWVQPGGLSNSIGSGVLGGPVLPEVLVADTSAAAERASSPPMQTADSTPFQSADQGEQGRSVVFADGSVRMELPADSLSGGFGGGGGMPPGSDPEADVSVAEGQLAKSVAALDAVARAPAPDSPVDAKQAQSAANSPAESENKFSEPPAEALAKKDASFADLSDPEPAATSSQRSAIESYSAGRPTTPAFELDAVKAMTEFAPSSGWFVWYWDRGLNLVYWQRRPSGHIVGAALERSRWIADLIAILPDSNMKLKNAAASSVNEGFRVLSSSGEVVYEWGDPVAESAFALCEVPLQSPLASWRMQCFVPDEQLRAGLGRSAMLTTFGGLAVFALTLTGLGWLLYRDYARDMREAGQRVSFVNQVSHELKTPLTNIRLYAELLERDLESVPQDQSDKPRRRLDVITTEAQRLSRLIGNVLTFARQQRQSLQLQPVPVNPGVLVREIAERFTPSLNEHGIVVDVETSDCDAQNFDPDFIEQIVGNLISNVEKYAASGGRVVIRCGCGTNSATIDVQDFGPGVPAEHRDDIFRPFARLSNDLRASSGTGIGLSIARDLARLHGGDLTLVASAEGCCFRAVLKAQSCSTA